MERLSELLCVNFSELEYLAAMSVEDQRRLVMFASTTELESILDTLGDPRDIPSPNPDPPDYYDGAA